MQIHKGDESILPFTQRPDVTNEYFSPSAMLPHALTVSQIKATMESLYDFLHEVNAFLVKRGYERFEELLLGNSFAGLLSELLVKSLSEHSSTLVRNRHVGGHPDLILRHQYPNDSVLRGTEGIELKASKQRGGWQGHNPEEGWLIIFRYCVDAETLPVTARRPTTIVEILAGKMEKEDWTFSGRSETSRRTITASINRHGVEKLRSNAVYRDPHYAVGSHRDR